MGTITGRTIINNASIQLQDTSNVRWGLAELLGWLNDGQNEIALLIPASSVQTLTVPLVAGARQTIPATAQAALDFVCNVDSTGETAGSSVRMATREALDLWVPDWQTGATVQPNSTVVHVCYSDKDPFDFYVYPPQPSTDTGYLRVVCMVIPDPVTLADVGGATEDSAIALADIYATSLMDYILYRAFQKDAETVDPQRAMNYRQVFLQTMQMKAAIGQAVSPNSGSVPVPPAPKEERA